MSFDLRPIICRHFSPQALWLRKIFETIWKLKTISYQKGPTKWVPDFHSQFWDCLRLIKFSCQQRGEDVLCLRNISQVVRRSIKASHKLKALFLSFRAKFLCFCKTFIQLQLLSHNELNTFLLLQLDGNFLVSKNKVLRKYLL